VKWIEAKAALAKRSPAMHNKEGSTPSPANPKAKGAESTAEHEILGPGWNHVVHGGRVFKAIRTDSIAFPEQVIAPTTKVAVTTRSKGKTVNKRPK
jgi:hypothetical protein